MDSKYYTPSIDEFFVGFEYEELESVDTAYEEEPNLCWNKYIWNQESAGEHALYNTIYEIEDDSIRVKYLDKSDIESCGFTTLQPNGLILDEAGDLQNLYVDNDSGDSINYIVWKDGPLRGLDETGKINRVVRIYRKGNIQFSGIIKNLSELRKLLKQIGISDTLTKLN